MSLSWNNQLDRVRAVFGLGSDQPLPEVNVDSLLIYRDHLRAMLGKSCFEGEKCDEDGTRRGRVLVCGIRHEIDPVLGVLCNVFGEHLDGDFPLSDVEVSEDALNREIIEDYRYWLRNSRERSAGR